MRYLTVCAERFGDPAVRDDYAGPIEPEELGLSPEICEVLRAWNEDYEEVFRLTIEQRRAPAASERIDALDAQGRDIAERMYLSLRPDAKIRYYSEGRLKQLWIWP